MQLTKRPTYLGDQTADHMGLQLVLEPINETRCFAEQTPGGLMAVPLLPPHVPRAPSGRHSATKLIRAAVGSLMGLSTLHLNQTKQLFAGEHLTHKGWETSLGF